MTDEERAVMRQALDFIRAMNSHGWLLADYESDMERTVADLEAVLAQEQAEPVQKPVRCPASHVCDCQEAGQPCARAAPKLAQEQAEPVQEPVAIVGTQEDTWKGYAGQWLPPGPPIKTVHMLRDLPQGTLLYTAPPQRKPLTQEEIEACRQQGYAHNGLLAPFDFREAARAIEQALKEKNR